VGILEVHILEVRILGVGILVGKLPLVHILVGRKLGDNTLRPQWFPTELEGWKEALALRFCSTRRSHMRTRCTQRRGSR
jgi:hypothetical protein